MSAVDALRPHARRVKAWARRRSSRYRADLERRYDLNQLQRFEAVLNRHGRSFAEAGAILEFGCGEGRLLQYLFEYAPKASVFGCDVLSAAVEACQRRYPAGRFAVNGAAPPLAFQGAAFDLIYSYSVFTHLSEANHQAWLAELARALAPGGVMLHTVHSHAYLRRAAMFSPETLAKYGFAKPADVLLREGPSYIYIVDNPAMPEYGHTIIRKEYIQARWPRDTGLEVVDYVEDAIQAYPEGCQDLVLLRKPDE